jgi:hypothetical protein
MTKKIAFNLLIFLLILVKYEICQEIDEDMMKAVACISLIKKIDSKIQDQRLISSYMLTCFMNIDESSIQNLLSSQMSNKLELDKTEVEKLTDISTLQTKYSQSEIKDYSVKLNSALEKLKNSELNMKDGQSQKGRKSSSKSDKSTPNAGLIEFIIDGFMAFFNPGDSFLVLIGFFVMAYFCLKALRKIFSGKKKVDAQKKKEKKNK